GALPRARPRRRRVHRERRRRHHRGRSGGAGVTDVKLSRRGIERWREGKPWIYESDVEAPKSLKGGEVVRVIDHKGYLLGQAFFWRGSKTSRRWLRWDATPIAEPFFAARLKAADALRRRLYPSDDTYRVIHGEADGLPGLVVDRYGDALSVQFLIPA